MNRETCILYICDQHFCDDPSCLKYENYECHHTTSPNHALNGKCEDPWNHPERFGETGSCINGFYTVFYVEREDGAPRITDCID